MNRGTLAASLPSSLVKVRLRPLNFRSPKQVRLKMFLWRWELAGIGSGKRISGSRIRSWPGPGHPFYQRLNELLDQEKFDEFAESECARFYAENNGRPSLTPGTYFRSLLIGYFEGIDSERGIAWRVADSLALRQFLRIGLDEATPDHSTISRTAG